MEEIFERGNMVITKSPVNKNYTWHISRFPAMKSDPEGMIELADAIYEAEGVDLRAEVARLTEERERMRELAERAYEFYSPLDWDDPDDLEEADEILFALTQIYDPDPDESEAPND